MSGEELVKTIESVIGLGHVDFVLVPWEGASRNLGYGFVNFTTAYIANMAAPALEGLTLDAGGRYVTLKSMPARIQGLVANMECSASMLQKAGKHPVLPVVRLDGEQLDFFVALRRLRELATGSEAPQPLAPQPTAWSLADSAPVSDSARAGALPWQPPSDLSKHAPPCPPATRWCVSPLSEHASKAGVDAGVVSAYAGPGSMGAFVNPERIATAGPWARCAGAAGGAEVGGAAARSPQFCKAWAEVESLAAQILVHLSSWPQGAGARP